MKYLSLALLFFSGIIFQLNAQVTPSSAKKVYTTAKVSDLPPTIDGLLDEAAWDQVEWAGDFSQIRPDNGAAPTEPTAFKILFDDKNLYVAFMCYDSDPDKVERRMTRRDGFEGDRVSIHIDSYQDLQSAFSFTISASGVISDAAVTNNGNNWDRNWDPIWIAKTASHKDGWVAEARIPLSQLRFSKKKRHVWGLQVERRLFRMEERSAWQHISNNAPGWVHLFGELQGINNIKRQKQIEISPYLLAQMERFEAEEGNPFLTGKDSKINVGMDGKIAVTSDLTLDFTVNPDFGQVEADPSQVNLSAFEIFFRERRPFFTEGKNILSYRVATDPLFHSRRIGRAPQYNPDLEEGEYMERPTRTAILGALKLTGRTKKGLSVGVLESVTKDEFAKIDKDGQRRKEKVEPMTNYFVSRVQQDLNKGDSQVGVMMTAINRNIDEASLEFLHKSAYTGGIDFRHSWDNRTYYLAGNVALSQVNGTKEAILRTQTSSNRFYQRPDADHLHVDSSRTSLSGSGGKIEFGRRGKGNFRYEVGGSWKSPGLAINDIGFMRSSDLISQSFWIGYNTPRPTKSFRHFSTSFSQYTNWDFGGVNLSNGLSLSTSAELKNYWGIRLGTSLRTESVSRSALRGGPSFITPGSTYLWMAVSSDERKKLRFSTNPWLSSGNHGSSDGFGVSMNFNYQPINSLNISLSPQYSWRTWQQQYVTTQDYQTLKRYINASIEQNTASLSLRFNYSIKPNLSLQYYGQPYVSTGNYDQFKRITDPDNNTYHDRFHIFNEQEISLDDDDESYLVDENQDGTIDYSFDNPNFDFLQFRSNFVMRWEYKPGSALFLVWNKERTENPGMENFSISGSVDGFLDPESAAHNTFLLKFTHRFVL
ncbi:MAG: hypothetical protein DHS20C17_25400 [Cyclobacteriaceae bacterium]|nr:MAG: hypothetical protein DHS20C17_25400 [Cyclobacteriaceae bacterium]